MDNYNSKNSALRLISLIIKISFNSIRSLPHLMIFIFHPNRNLIKKDINRWLIVYSRNYNVYAGLLYLLCFYPEFRNLFYYRINPASFFIQWILPQMNTLYITTENIGEGLFIQHGFATIISAKSVGKNCWINQQVTIGYLKSNDAPVIQDNVIIGAGAKVLGDIRIGENSVIGANAVVIKNVPQNCTVVGVPAYIIKKNGQKTYETL
jgi:serine O-acetyltransferase